MDYIELIDPMDNFARALELHKNGEMAEAKSYYMATLQREPNHADALHLLGLIEFLEKNYADAERLIRAAINIRNDVPDYYLNFGLVLFDLYRYPEANQAFDQSLALRPEDAVAQCAKGNVLYAMGQYLDAENAYTQAKSYAPYNVQTHLGLANALIAQERLDEAKTALQRALSLDPECFEAIGNMGVVLRKQGQLQEAEGFLRKALDFNPHYAEALNNLGAILLDMGKLEEAEASLHASLDVRPKYASAYNNLGNVFMTQRRIVEAEAAYTKAIEITPDFVDAKWNRSLIHLLNGDFSNGWHEYEWRLKRPDMRNLYPNLSQPEWRGEYLDGKSILLYAEQGMGDTLQFIRFAPLVAMRGGRVILRCQPLLKRLLQGTPDIEMVLTEDDLLPHFEVQCPLLSLPYRLGIDDEKKIPSSTPYLAVEHDLKEIWGNKLKADSNLKLGLVWAGAPRKGDLASYLIDRRRSMSLALLEPVLGIQGVSFYSLQKGDSGREAENYSGRLINLMDEVQDFSETAALISHLDLVISVDTAVAHLAAALATPVWMLSRFDGCWRWMQEREDSPWYPTMRLFRQQQPGDWHSVIEKVVELLQTLAANHVNHSRTDSIN